MSHLPLRIGVDEIVGIAGTSRRCVIRQLLPGGLVGVRDLGSSRPPEPVSIDSLIHAPPAEDARPGAAPSEDSANLSDTEISQFPEKNWVAARRRLEIIKPFLDAARPPAALVKARAQEAGCHWTRLYAWMSAYRNSGGSIISLMNRKSSVPKGVLRLHPAVEALLKEVIEKHYLTKQRLRVTKIDEILRMECEDRGIPLETEGGVAGYCKPHINTIRSRIRALSSHRRDAEREGRNKVSKLTVRGEGYGATYPLELVQIDHTIVDVILVDDQHGYVMGRPWLTLAIDVFSRMVVGYYLSFDTPGALATGICVSQVILPKEGWLREHAAAFSQPPEWPCYGNPVNLHFDNAREFRGDTVKRACEKYGINVIFRPVKTPHYGGHIESLNAKLAGEFSSLPGATFSNPTQRGKHYDSEAEAVVGYKEFSHWLANHLLCVYHYRPHSDLDGKSPIQRWEQGCFQGTELAPPRGKLPDRYLHEAAVRLQMDFLPYVERAISEHGVYIDKIAYMSPVLRRWINAKDPKNSRRSRYFIFRRDPRDISIIYFWNPELEKYEAIPYRRATQPPATLWEVHASRKYLREVLKQPDAKHKEAMIFSAIRRNRELIEAAKARKGKMKAAGKFRAGIHSERPQPAKPAGLNPSENAGGEEASSPGRRDVAPFADLGLSGLPRED